MNPPLDRSLGGRNWRTERAAYDETHDAFREQVRRFFEREMEAHGSRWEADGLTDRDFWLRAGAQGLLGAHVPEAYGGPGLNISYSLIVTEELAYAGAPNGFQSHSDVCIDYVLKYASEEAKRDWLPQMVSGEAIGAIAMTEPGAGSDLRGLRTRAERVGDELIVNGSKTYISNGQNADVIITALRIDGATELSLVMIPADLLGVKRGRNLYKIGHHSADTSEIFFEDVVVPAASVLGEAGRGLRMLVTQLPQERLSIAAACQAGAQRAFDEAVAFTRGRSAFGRPILDFQNTRFTLAALQAKLQVGWAHLDWAIRRHLESSFSADEAAAAKLWHSETLWEVVDAALQLHGGAGYMNEYPIARFWRDARVMRIYGGTSEIMKEIVGRSL